MVKLGTICTAIHYSFVFTGSSSFKLPSINMKKYFPHLLDKDNKGDLDLLRHELDEHTTKIKTAYAGLVFKLQEYIITLPNSLNKITKVLKLFEGNKFEELLAQCSTTEQVFEKLHPHFAFFDFNIIKLLTSNLGAESHKKRLKQYKKMFKKYSEQRVCECPSDTFGEVKKSEKVLVFKVDRHIRELKVEEILKLQIETLELDLRLLHVDNGCVKLSFRAYNTLDEIVITEDQQKAICKLGVIGIRYDNEIIYSVGPFQVSSDIKASG